MTPSHAFNVDRTFGNASPKPVDFPQAEYEGNKDQFDRIAQRYGYRLAGIRLQRAVFSTKNS